MILLIIFYVLKIVYTYKNKIIGKRFLMISTILEGTFLIFITLFKKILRCRNGEIKNEIREWSIFFSQRGKDEPLGGYSVKLIPKEMENKKKVEEVKQINIKIDELRNKIVKISTEIYENNIYPF